MPAPATAGSATPTVPGSALTKIQPPRPRGRLIARPQLEHRLAQALAALPLALTSAPAGFGKTAAIARQIVQRTAARAATEASTDRRPAPLISSATDAASSARPNS